MATVVAFHAHPDDEVVLTGGTIARAVAAGHRVVVVTATDGRVHNEDTDHRLDELRSSARILGAQRVECLGYADSGYGPLFYPDPPGRTRFGRPTSTRRPESWPASSATSMPTCCSATRPTAVTATAITSGCITSASGPPNSPPSRGCSR